MPLFSTADNSIRWYHTLPEKKLYGCQFLFIKLIRITQYLRNHNVACSDVMVPSSAALRFLLRPSM
jgi:hypothetical protein